MDDDDQIIIFLNQVHLRLSQVTELLQSRSVSNEKWPEVGKLVSEIEGQIKQMELALTGFGS